MILLDARVLPELALQPCLKNQRSLECFFALARIETVYGEGPIRFPCHRLLLEAIARFHLFGAGAKLGKPTVSKVQKRFCYFEAIQTSGVNSDRNLDKALQTK